jgi:hypothetical protein
MKSSRNLLAGALTLVAAFGQTHGDFTGTWKMDPARSESAHQDAASVSTRSTLVIGFTDSGLTMETTRTEHGRSPAFHETLHVKLDGSETTGPGDAGIPVTARAHWDGDRLVVETERNVQNSTVTTRYVYTLSADSKEMTVDKTLTVQHGYQGMGATPAGHGKDVFVRVAN